MTIHILDIVTWLILCVILYYIVDWLSGGEWTEEMGILGYYLIIIVFTIIYTTLFGFCGYDMINYIDILSEISINIKL